MTKRRPLVAGLKKANPKLEREFVFGGKKKPPEKEKPVQQPTQEIFPPAVAEAKPEPHPTVSMSEPKPTGNASRSPLTTRLRSDLFTALKRASLERQLNGQTPNTVQEILEEALEPWLREQGYLK